MSVAGTAKVSRPITVRNPRGAETRKRLALATTLNSVARVLLGQVDELDAAQDQDPVVSAFGHNADAAASGRRIISLTDGGDFPPAA